MADRHYRASVPESCPSAYWENWWEQEGPVYTERVFRGSRRVRPLRSLRSGSDAKVDAEVLHGRLASGLYFVTTWEEQ